MHERLTSENFCINDFHIWFKIVSPTTRKNLKRLKRDDRVIVLSFYLSKEGGCGGVRASPQALKLVSPQQIMQFEQERKKNKLHHIRDMWDCNSNFYESESGRGLEKVTPSRGSSKASRYRYRRRYRHQEREGNLERVSLGQPTPLEKKRNGATLHLWCFFNWNCVTDSSSIIFSGATWTQSMNLNTETCFCHGFTNVVFTPCGNYLFTQKLIM